MVWWQHCLDLGVSCDGFSCWPTRKWILNCCLGIVLWSFQATVRNMLLSQGYSVLWSLEIVRLSCELNQFSDLAENSPYWKINIFVIGRIEELIWLAALLCGCRCWVEGRCWECLTGQILSCCYCLEWMGTFSLPKWYLLTACSSSTCLLSLDFRVLVCWWNLWHGHPGPFSPGETDVYFFLSETCFLFLGRILTLK